MAPSALSYTSDAPLPREMTEADIEGVLRAFETAAARAKRAGFDGIQIHAAHGYLVHQFLSPVTNRRCDAWGGSPEKRRRFASAVVDAVRKGAQDLPVMVRLSACDWIEGGCGIEDAVALVQELAQRGVAAADVSSGGIDPSQQLPGSVTAAHGAFAHRIKEQTGMVTFTSGGIVEPLQGEGGIIPAEEGFMQGLRELCDSNDMLLIFDEVQCGMGRTGKPFCFQHYGVKPDVLTLAKALGGGLPMGACLAFERAAGVFSPGDHAATFGGNVAAAALAEVLLAKLPSLSGEVASNGAYLTQRLNEVVAKHPDKAIEVRGRGFMQGIDLKVPPRDVIAECMKRGLLVCSAGYTVLRFVPPLIASREDIDKAASIVDEALSAI